MLALLPLALGMIVAGAPAGGSNPSAMPIAAESCDFGEIYSFHDGECNLAFFNPNEKPVRILSIEPTKRGSSVDPTTVLIPPHTKVYVKAKINAEEAVGSKRFPFRFTTDEKNGTAREVSVGGYILSALDDARPELDFGVVDLAAPVSAKSVALGSHETASFRIAKILESPRWLAINISADGHSIVAKVKPDASWGLNSAYIKVAIDTPRQSEAWILVKADVHGDVVPDANPFDMGMMRFGNRNEHLIRLTSRSGQNFTIGRTSLEGLKGDVAVMPCRPAASGCQMIRLLVSDEQHAGAVKGNITIELPGYGRILPVTVWGVLFPKNVRFEESSQLDGPKGGDSNKTSMQSPSDKKPVQLSAQLKKLTSNSVAAKLPPPPGRGPVLKWTVANGSSIYGFQIFRADSDVGPFVLINASPVRATRADDALPYQWRDTTAVSGRIYWYSIGTVDYAGQKKLLTGTQKVVAE